MPTDFGLGIGAGGGGGYEKAPIRKFTATALAPATTLTGSDATVLVDTTAATASVVLPPAPQCLGRIYAIKKIDASAHVVGITDLTGANVEGAASLSLSAQYATARVQSDGTVWWLMGKV